MKRVAWPRLARPLFYPDGLNNLAELGQAGSTKVLMFPFATPCKDGVFKTNNEFIHLTQGVLHDNTFILCQGRTPNSTVVTAGWLYGKSRLLIAIGRVVVP